MSRWRSVKRTQQRRVRRKGVFWESLEARLLLDGGGLGTLADNVAPILDEFSLHADVISENRTLTVSGMFRDPDVDDLHQVVIDWGGGLSGGQADEGTTTISRMGPNLPGAELVQVDGGWRFSAAHRYLDDNPTGTASDRYAIRATVDDGRGGVADSAEVSPGGNVLLTGHQVLAGNSPGLDVWMLDYLRGAGGPHEIPREEYDIGYVRVFDRGAPGGGAFGTVVEASPLDFLGNNRALQELLAQVDVLYVPSSGDLGSSLGSTALGIGAPEIATFLRNGGDLAVESSNSNPNFYNFLPTRLRPSIELPGAETTLTITTEGAALGLTQELVAASRADTVLPTFNDAYTIFERAGAAPVSIGLQSGTVRVKNDPPQIGTLELDAEAINEGDTVVVTGSFTDLGPLDTHTVTIDWGNPTAPTTTQLGPSDFVFEEGVWQFHAVHRYTDDNPTQTDEDIYTVTVQIEDDDAGSSSRSFPLRVRNVPPSVGGPLGLSATTGVVGNTVRLEGAFADPGAGDTHRVVIDWGGDSGLPGERTTTIPGPGSHPDGTSLHRQENGIWRFTAVHEYPTPPLNHRVTATVTDDDGGSGSHFTFVGVANAEPDLAPLELERTVVTEGDSVTVRGTFFDPDAGDTHIVEIDWGGDGDLSEGGTTLTTANLELEPLGDGIWAFTAPHIYADDNPSATPWDEYYITAIVHDDRDGTSERKGVARGGNRDGLPLRVENATPQWQQFETSSTTLPADGVLTVSGGFFDPGLSDQHSIHLDWGDGSPPTVIARGTVPAGTSLEDLGEGRWRFHAEHAYGVQPSGTLTINATVTDDDSGEAITTANVIVDHGPPEFLEFELNPPAIVEGGTVTVTGEFLDPGSSTQRVTIDWGKGEDAVTLDTSQPLPPGASLEDLGAGRWRFTAQHRYRDDEPGDSDDAYLVAATVVNARELAASTEASVAVSNGVPQLDPLAAFPGLVSEGGALSLRGTFIDPGLDDTHIVTVDWGATEAERTVLTGTTTAADGTLTHLGGGLWEFAASHTYIDNRPNELPESITVVVTDDDGGSAEIDVTLIVRNAAPVITALELSDREIAEDGSVTLTGVFSDVGLEDRHSVVIHWGGGSDGQADEGSTTFTTTGVATNGDGGDDPTAVRPRKRFRRLTNLGEGRWSFTATHQYLDDNPSATASDWYTVQVNVTDNDGAEATDEVVLQVRNTAPSIENLDVVEAEEGGNRLLSASGLFRDARLADTHTVEIFWGLVDATGAEVVTVLQTDAARGGGELINRGAGRWAFAAEQPFRSEMLAPDANGTVTVRVRITDDDGGSDFETRIIDLGSRPPRIETLELVRDQIAETEVAEVQGTFFDPDLHEQLTIAIDWGQGTPTTIRTVGELPAETTLLALEPGRYAFTARRQFIDDAPSGTSADVYPIRVTISDGGDPPAVREIPLTVANTPPTAGPLVLSRGTVAEGETVIASGSFFDPGLADIHTVLLDWGDGGEPTAENVVVTALGDGNWNFTAERIIRDDEPSGSGADEIVVIARVQDDDLGEAMASAPLTVNNIGPTPRPVTLTTAAIDENGTAVVEGTFTDPGQFDTHSIVIDWSATTGRPRRVRIGEGTTTITTLGPNPAGTELEYLGEGEWRFAARHQYRDDNPTISSADVYLILVEISDDDSVTASEAALVTVNNVAPVFDRESIRIETPQTPEPRAGAWLDLTAAFEDVGQLDIHDVHIAWGDGDESDTRSSLAFADFLEFQGAGGGSGSFRARHIYQAAGEYTVRLTVFDDDGGSDQMRVDVTVHPEDGPVEGLDQLIELLAKTR